MKILVIGGYGNFGKRLVYSLMENYAHAITIAGRSEAKGQYFCKHLEKQFNSKVAFQSLNVQSDELAAIFKKLNLNIVVNASGPFQDQARNDEYRVAQACIDSHCHYIDFADARNFVANFSRSLNANAQDAKVMLVTGASTVPGLSSAVIDNFAAQFRKLQSIEYGISPGNKAERGRGTIASILSYTGKPFSTLIKGKYQTIFGWQNLMRFDFGPPLGKRWMSNCNIPDLDLLPQRYRDLENVSFKAGLEVTFLHCGLWILSWLSRVGLIKNWARYTNLLITMSEWLSPWGSDTGGMYVHLKGLGLNKQMKEIRWQLIAEDGAGPNVPTISAELLIARIVEGNIIPGAMPCLGLFTLDDFFKIAARWNIRQREEIS